MKKESKTIKTNSLQIFIKKNYIKAAAFYGALFVQKCLFLMMNEFQLQFHLLELFLSTYSPTALGGSILSLFFSNFEIQKLI